MTGPFYGYSGIQRFLQFIRNPNRIKDQQPLSPSVICWFHIYDMSFILQAARIDRNESHSLGP